MDQDLVNNVVPEEELHDIQDLMEIHDGIIDDDIFAIHDAELDHDNDLIEVHDGELDHDNDLLNVHDDELDYYDEDDLLHMEDNYDNDDDDLLHMEDNYDNEAIAVQNMRELEYGSFYANEVLLPSVAKKVIYKFQPFQIQKCSYALWDAPCARSGHRIVADEGNFYLLGGYNPGMEGERQRQELFQELWRYNFATNTWHLLLNSILAPNMPKALASNALVMHNNKLISHGGTGHPFGVLCSNDCYVYNIRNKPEVNCLRVTGERPTAQYGPGIVIHENYLYTIGGTTGFDYSCDVYRLDLNTNIWERVYISRPEIGEDPEGRYRHEVVYDGKHIYVLGGGTAHSVYDLQRIPAFNLEKNCWDHFDTLSDRSCIQMGDDEEDGYPRPRKCFSCVQRKNEAGEVEAFIAGGLQVLWQRVGEGDFRSYFGDIWRLNLNTKQWTHIRKTSLPKPLYFHSAAHSGNDCMWIFGGIEYSMKDNRRCDNILKMWMTVPKLSEIAWEAITFYNSRLNEFSKDKLLTAGLPARFVARIGPLRDKEKFKQTKMNFPNKLLRNNYN